MKYQDCKSLKIFSSEIEESIWLVCNNGGDSHLNKSNINEFVLENIVSKVAAERDTFLPRFSNKLNCFWIIC